MTKKDALKILAILKAAYPHSFNGMSEKEALGTASVWCTQFADMSANIVLMAVNKAISTSKYPPSIAEVKDKVASIYWEAYEAIILHNQTPYLSDEAFNTYKRICEETRDYKCSKKMMEPHIHQMLCSDNETGFKMIE